MRRVGLIAFAPRNLPVSGKSSPKAVSADAGTAVTAIVSPTALKTSMEYPSAPSGAMCCSTTERAEGLNTKTQPRKSTRGQRGRAATKNELATKDRKVRKE